MLNIQPDCRPDRTLSDQARNFNSIPDDAVGKIAKPPGFGGCGSGSGRGLAVGFDHLKDRIGYRAQGAGRHCNCRQGSDTDDAGTSREGEETAAGEIPWRKHWTF